jgi:hypothetical protein
MVAALTTITIMATITNDKKVNVYLPSLRMKVPDHAYVFGSLLLQ